MTDSEKLDEILRILRSGFVSSSSSSKQGTWEQGGQTGNDSLLDGQYGDPAVFKTEPKDWDGASQVGVKASQVPAEYGHAYADMMDRFGDKAKRENQLDKNGKATYWRKYQEAACFRGWAKRNAGKQVDPF